VIAKVPSAAVWWQELAPVSIQGLAPNQFHTLTFSLPAQLASQIGTASDAVFIIAVNAPAGTYLVDNLRLSEPAGGTTGTTGSTSSGSGGTTGSGGSSADSGTTTTGAGGAIGGASGTGGSSGGPGTPGETGPATVDGNYQGEPVPAAHAFSIVRSEPLPQMSVVITSEQSGCALTQEVRYTPGTWLLYLDLLELNPEGGPIGPGSYPIGLPATDTFVAASAELSRVEPGCEEGLDNRQPSSGHIELETVGPAGVTGSYSITFDGEAGTLSGSFAAPLCVLPSEQPNPIACAEGQ
jgi:hypothetical protein